MNRRIAATTLMGVLLFLILPALSRAGTPSDTQAAESVRVLIDRADSLYWFALHGRSMGAAKKALGYLARAEAKLDQAEQMFSRGDEAAARALALGPDAEATGEDLDAMLSGLRRELVALRDSDLHSRREVMGNTHYGFFPLSRLIRPTLFSNPRATGLIEVLDDPDEVAVRFGIESVIGQLKGSSPQHDVFFVSQPRRPDLEHEAKFLFHHAGFSVHNRREMVALLSDSEIREVELLVPSHATLAKLMRYCSTGNLALVRLTKIDEVESRNHAYVVEGKEYKRRWLYSWENTIKHGCFSIDRRDMLVPVIAMHLVLAGLAVLLYRALVRFGSLSQKWPSWSRSVVAAGLGFVWGRLLIWAIAPILRGIEPAPETLFWWSFWWSAAVGAALIVGPGVALYFMQRRFQGVADLLGIFNRVGPFLAAVSMGSGAFMAQSLLFFLGAGGWWGVPAIVAASTACGYLVGRALDETNPAPLWTGVAAAAVSLVIGVAWCHADVTWIAAASAIPVAMFAVFATQPLRRAVTAKQIEAEPHSTAPEGEAHDCGELMQLALEPPFYETASYREVWSALEPWQEGKTVRLAIIGAAGIGKSSTLRQMQLDARRSAPNAGILTGSCPEPEPGANPQPFEPFSAAIAQHFTVNLLAPPSHQLKHIDDALGGVFKAVVPFSSLLFPAAGQSQTGSKKEVFISIATMFRQLAKTDRLMLVLDDVHWMDPASRELLEFLLCEFPDGGDCPLAIVMASREPPEDDAMRSVRLSPPNEQEMHAILTENLRLGPDAAATIVEMVGPQKDNLFCLFQIIVTAARKDLLEWRDDAFRWRPSVDISEQIPDDYRRSVEASFAERPEFRPILECAACQGREFNVESLRRGLGMPRLEVIHMLDTIEQQTGLIYDVRTEDDLFAFRSPFLLEVLRNVFEVSARGPRDSKTPQRFREYHGRMAQSLEATLSRSPAMIYLVANYYYAAGARYGAKAQEFAVRAARAASDQYQHELARKYIDMARQCATVIGADETELERELLLIECHAAHVEGRDRVRVAGRSWTYLDQHPDATFSDYVATAQASYDAGVDTRDQAHFARCAEIAERMVERFSGPLEQAEAHHFWGISLPVNQSELRRQYLRRALELVAQCPDDDLAALRLKSRVANSLAEQLSYGSKEDREAARDLFQVGIQLKQRDDIRDIPGLAVAHGGLGRLAFFGDPADLELAEHHFLQDLMLSEKTGSLTGQTKMHSLLGACKIQREDLPVAERYAAALKHYEASYATAEEQFDKYFALVGLIECHETLGQHDEANQRGDELVRRVKEAVDALSPELRAEDPSSAIPRPCIGPIQKVLDLCQTCSSAAWRVWLRRLFENAA